jgi:hypothetical protein
MAMSGPYDPSLRPVLLPLMDDLRDALGDGLLGLYLYGSAVSGGFDQGVSDIDLVSVTRRRVEELDLNELDRVHRRVTERDESWADRLEIVYVADGTLSELVGGDAVAVISPGEPLHVTGPASGWLQNWFLVRETGIALVGPPASDVIAPISRAEFLAAVKAYLEYLRGIDSLGYAVLSACRALCTLHTGEPCSKQEGAAFGRAQMPEWTSLIDLAVSSRLSKGMSGFENPGTRAAARRFVNLLADVASVRP